MRYLFLPLVLLVCSCSNEGATPSPGDIPSAAPLATQQTDEGQIEGNDGPAAPVEPGYLPLHKQAGYEMARDAAVFARVQPVSRPSPGLDSPETGTGEYANTDWKLPSSEADSVPSEMRPQPKEEVVPPPTRAEQDIIPHERVIEDIPSTRIVEDLP